METFNYSAHCVKIGKRLLRSDLYSQLPLLGVKIGKDQCSGCSIQPGLIRIG